MEKWSKEAHEEIAKVINLAKINNFESIDRFNKTFSDARN